MRSLLAPRHWGGHLLMLVAVAAAVGLGVWQLEAWQAGRAAEARDLSSARAEPLAEVIGPDDRFPGSDLGRPVTLSGEWLGEDTLYVAGRRNDGVEGYWVTTPVRIGGAAMPVVRGWSERPTSAPVAGEVEVTGWLQPSEGDGSVDEDPTDSVIPQMRVASIVEYLDTDLYSAFVVAQEPTEGLAAVTPDAIPEVSSTTSLRNLLYAFQWWIFGLFALYLWWRWCLDVLERLRGDPDPGPEPGGPDPIASGS